MNSASSESHEPVVAGERLAGARRVDGNAAAGILSEVFVSDLTAARTPTYVWLDSTGATSIVISREDSHHA